MRSPSTAKLKHSLHNGALTAGAFLQLNSNMSAEIFAQAGFDWLVVDMEHAPVDFGQLLGILQAISTTNTTPFVRAPWNDAVAIKRIMDAGAKGVLIPYVNNAAEAQASVSACKFPPIGTRGAATSPRAAAYGGPIKEYLQNANDESMVVVAVETREAVNNLDEILQTKHLDGVFIGPADLATSMGYLGDATAPEVTDAIAIIEEKVLASDKFLGTIACDWTKAMQLYNRGYQWLIVMQDGVSLAKLAHQSVEQFSEFKQLLAKKQANG